MKNTVNWSIVKELKNLVAKETSEELHLSWYVVRHGYVHIHLNEKFYGKYDLLEKAFKEVRPL